MKLFLSHATADGGLVETILGRLVPFGIGVYAAEYDNKAGEHLPDKIKRAISEADLVVVLLTTHAGGSNFVQQEIGFALGQSKLVVPIVSNDAAHQDLGFLVGTEWINLDEDDPAKAMQELTNRVGEIAVLHHQNELALQRALRLQADQKHQEDLIFYGAVLVIIGAIILAMGNN